MAGPYRSGSCGECGSDDALVTCRYCGARCCVGCAHDETCVRCVRRAFAVLRDVIGARVEPGGGRHRSLRKRLFGVAMLATGLTGGLWIAGLSARFAPPQTTTPAAAMTAAPAARDASSRQPILASEPFALPSTARAETDPCGAPIHPLAQEGRATENPRELVARAQHLHATGLDLRMVHVAASVADVDRWKTAPPFPSRVVPKSCADGRKLGLVISGISTGSTAEEIGLANGDVVTAVNGRPFDQPEALSKAYELATRARVAVIEVIRAGRPLVMVVDWPAA